MKKFLSLALALVMTMSLVTISAGAKDFTDSSKITYSDAVDVMSAIKVVDGYAEGDFRPTNTLTRGAAAKIICNMILGPTTAGALPTSVAPFKDVPAGSTFAGYIAYCSQKGIINGYSDGTFRPSGTLNGYAFMKMLLGALGYDGSIEGFTGANWSVNVAKLAMGIGLDAGLTEGFNGSKAVTREEACLYAFNTLQADMVEYSDKGQSITVGGVEITTTPSKAEPVTTTSKSTAIGKEEGPTYTVQFGERYFKDLEKLDNKEDEFGRPAVQWVYDDDEICVVADEANVSYSKAVEEKDLYKALNISDNNEFSVYVNGVLQTKKVEGKDVADLITISKSSTEDFKYSDTGVLVEVYYDKDSSDNRVVVVNTYIGEVDDVDTNDDDERIVTVDGKDFVTEEFEEDDMVLYTVADGEIQTMVPAEKLTGELTKTSGEKYTIDGTVYELSATCEGTATPKKDVDFYLDPYGYIISIEEAEGEVSVDNLAYVESCGTSRGTGWARLIFADGSAKTVDTTKTYAEDASILHSIVSFKVEDNGEYKLTAKNEDADAESVTKPVASYEKGKTTMKFGDGKNDYFGLDSKTVFVYAIEDSEGDVEYKVYTGYKSAPSFASYENDKHETVTASVAAFTKDGKSAATFVVVSMKSDNLSSASKELTFVASQADVDKINDGSSEYYEFQAVVDGKLTTVKVDAGKINPEDTVYVWKNVKYDADDVVIGFDSDVAADVTEVFTSNKTSNEVVTLGDKTYAYTDDVKVFFIDGDKVTEGDVDDIREDNGTTKDPYASIYFTLDEDEVDLIVLVKN